MARLAPGDYLQSISIGVGLPFDRLRANALPLALAP